MPVRSKSATATQTIPRWRVKAWVMSPGDFPSRDLKAILVTGQGIEDAIKHANQSLTFRSSPQVTIVSVVRVSPPENKDA